MKFKHALAATAATVGLLATASPAQARGAIKIGAQGAFVLPVGDWGDVQGVGFGALLNMDMGLTEDGKLQLTGRLGYIHMTGKEIDLGAFGKIDGPSFGMIPVYAGVKYFVIPGLYLGAELGPTITMTGDTGEGAAKVDGETNVKFGATAGLGYMFKDLDARAFLLLPSLGDASDVMALGITVGYRFAAL